MQRAFHARGLGYLPKLAFIITVGLITSAVSYQALATDVFTDPVGFITLTAQGSNGIANARATSLQGLGMTQLPTNRGTVASSPVSNQVVDTSSTWANNDYTNGLFFIEITSGPNAGLIDDVTGASATDHAVYTANDNHTLISAGQTYKIYPHWTLATAFGPNDESGLKKGSSTTADQVKILNPLTQLFTTYFFSSGGLVGVGWRSAGSTDQGNTKLYLDQGVLIARNEGTNLLVKLVGGVKLGNTVIPINTNNNLVANVYASSAMTLTNSNLLQGDVTKSLTGGSSTTADQVKIFNPATGLFTTYFWSTGGLVGAGWRSAGSTDQGGTQIPLGQSLLIVRKPGRAPINWYAPAPY
jgi:uncharacterized protein (TIGR02597 family)